MINQDIKYSKAYKTYHEFAIGKVALKKVRKFKKTASPSKKMSPVLEEELVKKLKRAKKPTKKSTTVPTVGVFIRDTPGVPVSKKKAPAKVDRGKGMDLLSDAALLEAAQLKKHSRKASRILTYFIDNDDDNNDDERDDVSIEDNDDGDSDADYDNDASDSKRTDSDEEENPNLNLKDDEEEETYDDEYVHTPDYYVPTDEESNYEYKEFDEEKYDELYKDVNMSVEAVDIEMPQNQGSNLGDTDDQPNVKATPKHDWLKKLKRPPTPDPD
nr:hypothetical protein [Tanacetum cinerariifolium]